MNSNLVVIPYKWTVPVALSDSIISSIAQSWSTTHPDAIAQDAIKLDKLRGQATVAHSEGTLEPSREALLNYYQHLTSSLPKLPTSLPPLPWYPLFSPTPSSSSSSLPLVGSFSPSPSSPFPLPTLHWDRSNILLNLAASWSLHAVQGGRRDESGLKTAIAGFQNAAGCLSHLLTLLPLLSASSSASSTATADGQEQEQQVPDLTPATVESLRDLMLAQAQEVFWQKGVMDRLKNTTIAKLALACSSLYSSSLTFARQASSSRWSFPEAWINHLQIKELHFKAVAQYRKSVEDLGANRYGDELGRLELADSWVRKAQTVNRKGVNEAVLRDLKGLAGTLTDNLARARKDNSLIYLESPTPASSLPPLTAAQMTRPTVPPALSQPPAAPLFPSLQPYHVHLTHLLYLDRRSTLLSSTLTEPSATFSALSARTLTSLGLPGSLEASTQPLGLPPSLRDLARQLKAEGGVARLREGMGDVRRVKRVVGRALGEVEGLLLQEEEVEMGMKGRWGTERWIRTGAGEEEGEGEGWRERVRQLKGVLEKAGESDGLVRSKFGEWEGRFELLGGEEDALERSIPSLSPSTSSSSSDGQAASDQTLSLRQLRSLLSDLHHLTTERDSLIAEGKYAMSAASGDDAVAKRAIIEESERLIRAKGERGGGGGVEEQIGLQEFEEVIEGQLGKFKGFGKRMKELLARGEDLLDSIKTANSTFLHHRSTSPLLLQRERALQELDSASTMYKEILNNLQEGLKFYADLGRMTTELKEGVREYTTRRNEEAQKLSRELELSRGVERVAISTMAEQGRAWRPEDGIRFG